MSKNLINDLERLNSLKAQGAITEDEYQQQKAVLFSDTKKRDNLQSKSKNDGWGWGRSLLVVFALLALGLWIESGALDTPTPENEKADSVERFFSYSGSHRELEQKIKEIMHDPDSYEHVETRFRDENVTIFVTTKFRAKNGFNATVTHTATATISGIDGHLIDWQMKD